MSGFVKLKRGNDWGLEYFAVEPLGPMGTADRKRAMRFDSNQLLCVRWPDGHESRENVTMKRCRDTVRDMGHSYPVEYDLPGFNHVTCNHCHSTEWVPLDAVEVWVE